MTLSTNLPPLADSLEIRQHEPRLDGYVDRTTHAREMDAFVRKLANGKQNIANALLSVGMAEISNTIPKSAADPEAVRKAYRDVILEKAAEYGIRLEEQAQ